MTRNRSILILALTAALLVASAFAIRWRYHPHRENEVNLGFATEILKTGDDFALRELPVDSYRGAARADRLRRSVGSFVAQSANRAAAIRLSNPRYTAITASGKAT